MQKIQVLAPHSRRSFWHEALLFWDLEEVFYNIDSPITICDNSEGTYNNLQMDSSSPLLVCGSLPHNLFVNTFTSIETICHNNGLVDAQAPQLRTDIDGFVSGDILLFLLDCFQRNRRRIVSTNSIVLATSSNYNYDVAKNQLSDVIKSKDYPMFIRDGNVIYTPLSLSDYSYVLQPEVSFLQSNPFVVKNYALLRFIKALLVTLCPSLKVKELWPNNSRCVISITGDVHDYNGIKGREDREYKDMMANCDILSDLSLEGRAAWYCSAHIATRHPKTFREAFSRGYEIQPHTYLETQYALENWDYKKQNDDLQRCYQAFEPTSGQRDIFRKGFRTHGYQSNYITREVLNSNECLYLSDLQVWESHDNLCKDAFEKGILYFGLPQKASGRNGRPLDLIEIPDTVPNDHVLYRLQNMSPVQAFDLWKSRFDRIARLGGYFQTCLHPYISLFEAAGRKQVYIELIKYMQSKGATFMLPLEVAQHFKGRCL